jgi:hypothetical protein
LQNKSWQPVFFHIEGAGQELSGPRRRQENSRQKIDHKSLDLITPEKTGGDQLRSLLKASC